MPLAPRFLSSLVDDEPPGHRRVLGFTDVVLLLLLVAAVLLAFQDVLSAERSLFYRDHVFANRPRWWFTIDALRRFELPALGRANPSGIPLELSFVPWYTPPALAFAFMEFETAFDWMVIAHYVILAAGAYLLALELGGHRLQAFAAGGVAALSGPITSLENLLPLVYSFAYAPWVYLGLIRALRKPRLQTIAFLAVAVGFHVQVPHPHIVLIDVLALAAIFHHVGLPLDLPRLGGLAAAGALGVGLASAIVIPVMLVLPGSRRAADLGEVARIWPVGRAQLIELVAPAFWSMPDVPFVTFSSVTGRPLAPYLLSLYFGSALCLAPLALLARRHRGVVFLAMGTLVLGVLASLGSATPVHDLIARLPVLSLSRYPIKYLMLASLALSLLVPLGLGEVVRAPRLFFATISLQLVLLSGAWMTLRAPEAREVVAGLIDAKNLAAPVIGLDPSRYPDIALAHMSASLLHALVFTGLVFLLAAAQGFARIRAELVSAAVALLVVFDLGVGAASSIFGASVLGQEPPEAVKAELRGQRFYTVTPGGRPAPVAHAEGDTYLEDSLRSNAQRLEYIYREGQRVSDIDREGASNPASVLAFKLLQGARGESAQRMLARLGVSRVSMWAELDQPGKFKWEIPGERPQFLYPIADVRPFVHAYFRWVSFDTREARPEVLLPRMTSREEWETAFLPEPSFGADLRPGPDLSPVETTTAAAACAKASRLERLPSERLERIEATLESPCRAVVVVQEIGMPGWKAFVDDTERPLFHAELGFIGTLVPPGAHRVRFEYVPYAPRWYRVTAGSTAIIAVLAALGLWRRRRNV